VVAVETGTGIGNTLWAGSDMALGLSASRRAGNVG
jgi:hypothetical protein